MIRGRDRAGMHERIAPEYVKTLGLRHVARSLDWLAPWRPRTFTWGEYRREQRARRRRWGMAVRAGKVVPL